VNSSVSWRDTYYTRSQIVDPVTQIRTGVSDEDINRTYYTAQAQMVGPVFNRIFIHRTTAMPSASSIRSSRS
jgi:hypothetical protein